MGWSESRPHHFFLGRRRQREGLLLEPVAELRLLTHLQEQLLVFGLVEVGVEPIPPLLDDIKNLPVASLIQLM